MGFPLLLGARGGVGWSCVGRGWVCLVPGKGTKLQRPPTVANVSLWECGTSKNRSYVPLNGASWFSSLGGEL